jgi:hypothetical protein
MEPARTVGDRRAAQDPEKDLGASRAEGSSNLHAEPWFRTFTERPHRRLALLLQLTDVAIKNSADVHAWNPYMRMIREGRPHIPLNQVNLVQGGLRVVGPVAAVGWEEPDGPNGPSLRAIVEEMDVSARRLIDELFADIVTEAPSGREGQDPWQRKRDLMTRAVGFLLFRAPTPAG